MTKLSFNVLDDLNQSLKVLSDFIAQKDTKEVIEKAISIMADSIKNGDLFHTTLCNHSRFDYRLFACLFATGKP